MSSLVARWLRRLARRCERLADNIDSHEHTWDGGMAGGVYGRLTCRECGYTELWQGRTHDGEPRDVIRGYLERMPGGPTGIHQVVK